MRPCSRIVQNVRLGFKTRYETEYFRLREKLTKILLEVACEQALEETRKAFPWSFSFFPLMVTLLLKY